MKMNFKKGFTLIELLVVVAIIGILASVVLASLNSARAKGSDAAIKANVSGIRANAELQFDTMGGCYANAGVTCSGTTTPGVKNPGACPAATTDTTATGGATIFALASIAQQIAAADAAGGFVSCSSTGGGTAWAVVAQYKSSLTKGWCVDSTGKSKEVTIGNSGAAQTDVDAEIASGACVE